MAALLVNLGIFAVGGAAGGSFVPADEDKAASVSAATVAVMTVAPLLLGMTLGALLSYRWPAVLRVAQVVGPALALLTIAGTLAAGFDRVSTVTLAAMHVVLALLIIGGLELIRRGVIRQRARA